MLFFQAIHKSDVAHILQNKEHVSDGMGSAAFLEWIVIAICIFFLSTSIMTFYMIQRRKKELIKEEDTNQLIEKYQSFLSSFLILPIDESFLGISKSKTMHGRLDLEDINDPKRRFLLTNEIYNCKKHLQGQQEIQLANYFFGLSLHTDVIQKLSSRDWTKKVWSIKMIASFKISEALPLINQIINDQNREIAIHAILARIAMDENLNVLSELRFELNDWEKHKIHYFAKRESIDFSSLLEPKSSLSNYALAVI